jgi:RND family efflux transporter MFP subunit
MSKQRIRTLVVGVVVAAAAGALVFFGAGRRRPVHRNAAGTAPARDIYYCPMHPAYRSDKPGNCPICSMKMVKLEERAQPASLPVPGTTAPASSSASEAAPPEVSPGEAIFVPPEKQQLIGMRSVRAEIGTPTKEIRTVGKVGYDETRLTHIHSKVSGYIEDVFADYVGKPVRAGDPLFTIYSPDLVATEQEYLLALRSRNLLRTSTLPSAAEGSENLVTAARERLRLWDVTESEIRSLETEGKAQRTITVYSPVAGVVIERAAYHHGTFVDPSKDLFTIVDLSHVWVLGEIYETDLPFVHPGEIAEIELPYSGRKIRGAIDFIYPFLDPKTRTTQVRIQLPNPDLTLKPDMFANIRIVVPLGRQVLVPADAVMDTGTEQYVFIDEGDGYVQPRQVKIGAEAGDKVGVQQGLRPGERVVTGANFIIDSESQLQGAFANMGRPSTPFASAGASGGGQAVAVEVLEPKLAKTGRNPIRLRIKDGAGNPVTGAQVEVTLFMPQMGAMPPMTSRATLAESGNGIYSGQIEFPMAWTWQTTVTVRRNGRVIGAAQTRITAR